MIPATAATNPQTRGSAAPVFGWLRRAVRNHAATIFIATAQPAATGLNPGATSRNHTRKMSPQPPQPLPVVRAAKWLRPLRARVSPWPGLRPLRAFGRQPGGSNA
jgi:hypothetical protein